MRFAILLKWPFILWLCRQTQYLSHIIPNKLNNIFLSMSSKCPIIQSPGGLADDAYRIIRTLRKNFETVNIIVPFWAKSASTLLSFGGTKIVMDEFGEFGPLDAQVVKTREDSPEYDRESALNDEHSLSRIETRYKEMFEAMYIRLYEHKSINIPKNTLSEQLLANLSKFYEPLLKQIDPYKLGEKRRILDIGTQYARRILTQYHPSLDTIKIRGLVDFLINGCPDHGYIIDYDLLSKFIDFVETSDKFAGEKYAKALRDVSLGLIDFASNEEAGYIGFVDENQLILEDKSTELNNEKEDNNNVEDELIEEAKNLLNEDSKN